MEALIQKSAPAAAKLRESFPLWQDLPGELVSKFEALYFKAQRVFSMGEPGGLLAFADLVPTEQNPVMLYGMYRIGSPRRDQVAGRMWALDQALVMLGMDWQRKAHSKSDAPPRSLHQDSSNYAAAALVTTVEAFASFPGAEGKVGHGLAPAPAVLGFTGCRRHVVVPLLLAFGVEHCSLPHADAERLAEAHNFGVSSCLNQLLCAQ